MTKYWIGGAVVLVLAGGAYVYFKGKRAGTAAAMRPPNLDRAGAVYTGGARTS